jgi:hypothetical protein
VYRVRTASRELAPGFPIGAALLETLGDLNADVRDALEGERAKLNHHGYPEDLPLPALWWGSPLSGHQSRYVFCP